MLLLLLAAGAAPWLAGLGPVRRAVAAAIARAVGRPVDLDALEAGWASGVEVRGLSVAGLGGEFGRDPLLEAATVRVRKPLHRLLLGGGDTEVEVDGLRLRLEEQAGGRTNLDDLIARFRPEPGAAPPAERVEREPTALRVRLNGAHVSLRRLARRVPAEPVDPFEGDPVILPADEGAMEVALEGFELDLVAEPASTRVRFGGAVRVNDAGGDVRGTVTVAGPVVRGSVEARGVDLRVLEPFLEGGVRGVADLAVEGEVADGSPSLRVRASARDLVAGDFREERVDLAARVEGARVAEGTLATASGLRLEGSGTADDLSVEGSHPRASFAVRKQGDAFSGTAEVRAVALGRLPPRDVALEFDVLLRGDAAEIRSARARAPDADLRASGTVALRAPFAGELSVEGGADLRLLAPLLKERAEVLGSATLRADLRVEPDGGVALRGGGEVRDLVVRGVFDEELSRERASFEIDAALEEDRDVLRVARGRVDEIAFEGRAAGLRAGELREVKGGVKGEVALSPLLPRLAGLEDVQDLKGRLAIDVQAATDAKGMTVAGSAVVTGLRFAGYGRRLDHERVSLRGKVERPPGGAWTGHAIATAAPVLVDVADFAVEGGRFRAEGKLEVADLAALPLLPAPLHLGGGLGGTFVAAPDEVTADLHSGSLTALWDGHGVEAAETTLSVAARRGEAGWSFDGSRATVAGATVALAGRDVELRGVLEELARVAPDLAPFAPRGRIALRGGLAGDDFSVDATVEDFAATVGGEEVSSPSLRVAASGARGEVLELRDLLVETGRATLRASGDVGERADLRVRVSGDLAAAAAYVPGLSGDGPFHVDATVSAPRPGADGPVVARGDLAFERAATGDLEARGAKVGFSFRGLLAGKHVEPAALSLDASARQLSRGGLRLDACDVAAEGAGAPFRFRATVRAREARAGDFPLEGARADLRGEVERWDVETLSALGVEGTLAFDRLVAHTTEWTGGSASATLRDGTLQLAGLKAAVNGGTVEGSGSIELAGERARWELRATSAGVRITERMADPLSYLLPVLRTRRGKGTVAGTLDARLDLAGDGTGADAIRRSLAGSGKVRFHDVDVKGSILLGEVTRALRALGGDAGESFEDLDVAFVVRGGRVKTDPFELKGALLDLECDGDVGLDGSLDILIVPRVKAVSLPVTIPFRVKGHLDDPKLRPAPLAPFR